MNATAAQAPNTVGPIFYLDGQQTLAVALGRLAIRNHLIYLYRSAFNDFKYERDAIRFALDHLVSDEPLDHFNGMAPPADFVLDGPVSATATIEAYFYVAQYEYVDEEIQRLQQAIASGTSTRYAINVCRRLTSEILQILVQNPDVPQFEQGWVPTNEQVRNGEDNKPIFMIVSAEEKPALLVLRASNVREVDEKQKRSRS